MDLFSQAPQSLADCQDLTLSYNPITQDGWKNLGEAICKGSMADGGYVSIGPAIEHAKTLGLLSACVERGVTLIGPLRMISHDDTGDL